jgi:hypothetical protein
MAEARDTELRGLVPRSLMAKIDALAQVDGTGSRIDWVISTLEAEADRQIHRASVLLRMVGGNPSRSESNGRDAE